MPPFNNTLIWISSTGVPLAPGAPGVNGVTYYAEIPPWAIGKHNGFAVSLLWDVVESATYTMDSANDESLSPFAAVGAGWALSTLGPIVAVPPVAAVGTIDFTRPGFAGGPGTINAGQIVQTPGGIQFQTTAPAVFGAFTLTQTVAIIALVPGVTGNVAMNTITVIGAPVVFDLTIVCNNPLAVVGGVGMAPFAGGEWQRTAESSRWRVARPVVAGGVSVARWTVKGIP